MLEFSRIVRKEFGGYNVSAFLKDVIVGVTVAAVALPLALAFGAAGGGGAGSGVTAAIVGGFIVAMFSCNTFQIAGPTGSMSAILLMLFTQHSPTHAFTAVFLSGIFLVLGGVCRLGERISRIPQPIVTGFTTSIAIIIITGQLNNFFGTYAEAGSNTAAKILNFILSLPSASIVCVILSLLSAGIVLFCPKAVARTVPPSLLAILIVWGITSLFKISVATIGDIPRTLLPESRLLFSHINAQTLVAVVSSAATLAVLGMIEGLFCAGVGAQIKGEKLVSNHELVVQGIANIAVPFFGGIPVTSAMSRSSVAIRSGGKTRVSGVVHSLVLLACMLFFAVPIATLPLASLAGVLAVAAVRMNDFAAIKRMYTEKNWRDLTAFIATVLSTLFFNLAVSVVIGIAAYMSRGRKTENREQR